MKFFHLWILATFPLECDRSFLKAVNSFFLGITWVLGHLGITPVLKEKISLKSLNFITIKYSHKYTKKC